MYFVFQNDILPKELRDFAYNQVFDMPRAAQVTRLTRRCAVTGRLRGNFHQFRVSRFIFRQEGTLQFHLFSLVTVQYYKIWAIKVLGT